jgi:RNA polymerase sigma factor (sigma-70 family)
VQDPVKEVRAMQETVGSEATKLALLERFHEQMLATARRYSHGPHDAEDAYQRAAEILLTHSPSGTDDELCRWLRSTVKREALALRRRHERVAPMGRPDAVPEPPDPTPDTHEHAERRERLRLGAQALGRLKEHELRCLLLRAEGYTYAEISAQTGFSHTKVNRCLAEGRQTFLARVASIESGEECRRLAPHLSALADGEAVAVDMAALRPHLRSCLACRARLREYRAAPARVAALALPAAGIAASGASAGFEPGFGPAASVGSEGALAPAAASAGSETGPVRGLLDSVLGAAQHKAAMVGERASHAAELAGAQKTVAVAASAAALAGGGAVTAERLAERGAGERAERVAEVRAEAQERRDARRARAARLTAVEAEPSPTAGPTPPAPEPTPPPEPAPAPAPEAPPPPPPPPPTPANEFGPTAAAQSPSPAPSPAPTPAPAPSGGSGGGGGGGGGSAEFAP